MLTYPKSTKRVRRMPMHLSLGHVTLMSGKFSPSLFLPFNFPQSDLGRRADSRWALPQISSFIWCHFRRSLRTFSYRFGRSVSNNFLTLLRVIGWKCVKKRNACQQPKLSIFCDHVRLLHRCPTVHAPVKPVRDARNRKIRLTACSHLYYAYIFSNILRKS